VKKFTPPHSNYTGRWDPLCDCGNFEVFFKSSTVPMGIPSVCVKEFLPTPHTPRKSKVPRQGGGGVKGRRMKIAISPIKKPSTMTRNLVLCVI
jgi:hypothetical protein